MSNRLVNCRRFIPISHLREFLGLEDSCDTVMLPASQDPSAIDWRSSMFPLETGNYEVYRPTDVPSVVAKLINDLINSGVSLNDIEDLLEGYLNALWDTSYLNNFPVLELHHSAIQELSKQCGSDLKNGITLKVNELKQAEEERVEEDMEAIANSFGYHRPKKLISTSNLYRNVSKPPKKKQFISPDNKYILSIDIDQHAGASFKGYAKSGNKYSILVPIIWIWNFWDMEMRIKFSLFGCYAQIFQLIS